MTPALLALAVVLPTAALALLSAYGAHRIMTGNGLVPLRVRPEDLGLAYEPVACRTSDGLTLRGWFVPASAPSARTILFFHGWGSNKGEILNMLHPLLGRGFNLLGFDFRACGESEGARLSVGYLEARDFDAAAAFLKSRRPHDSYGVFGLSMGAMVAFCGLARRDDFKAAVLESLFRSHDLAVDRYLRFHSGVPRYPLVPMIQFWLRRGLGADPEATCPERVAASFRTPLLAIYGGEDPISTAEMGRGFLARLAGPKELWVVPGADHAKCAKTAGEAYADSLARFYLAHMP